MGIFDDILGKLKDLGVSETVADSLEVSSDEGDINHSINAILGEQDSASGDEVKLFWNSPKSEIVTPEQVALMHDVVEANSGGESNNVATTPPKELSPKEAKTITVIDAGSYVADDEHQKRFETDNLDVKAGNKTYGDDPLRWAAAKYWVTGEDTSPKFLKKDFEVSRGLGVPFVLDVPQEFTSMSSDSSFYTTKEVCKLTPDKSLFTKSDGSFDRALWLTFVNGGWVGNCYYEQLINTSDPKQGGRRYEDHTCQVFTPYALEDVKILGNALATRYADLVPHYNFFIRNYEEVSALPAVDLRIIPSVYAMESQLIEGNEMFSGDIESTKLNSLNGLITSLKKKKNSDQGINRMVIFDRGQYFEEWHELPGLLILPFLTIWLIDLSTLGFP